MRLRLEFCPVTVIPFEPGCRKLLRRHVTMTTEVKVLSTVEGTTAEGDKAVEVRSRTGPTNMKGVFSFFMLSETCPLLQIP